MTPRNRDQRPPEGERRKDAALLLLEARRESYVRQARRVLLEILLRDGIATMDDVRAAVELPDGVNPKLFGAVPTVLARAGVIRRDDWVPTRRAEAHARRLTRWRLADVRKAERWLAAHEPLPDLTTGDQLALPFDEKKSPTAPSAKKRAAGEWTGSNPITGKDSNHGKA
ncbi:hypothetical protein KOR34_19590 [Posidoniimonas corsicana]|uniref:Uncharacterized protein n=1 Tax=Posidoniimonas corsicana TaxID=1938618 RepID=A0A5C5VFY8_9BACT|nr:hypothetical protein [Posidoniimonas corsicana]TWT37013.1 hypothetical protein KOR34_19590 [Posidoniimonas corsicana]